MCHTIPLLIIMLAPAVFSSPNGAPPGACSTMSPSHNSVPSTLTTPYTIALSATTYDCGGTINVTLSGTTQFKGFLCQPRPDPNNSATVGSLTDIGTPKTSTNRCPAEMASLTHATNSVKTSFIFSWTQSGTTNGNFYIVCTVVQTKTLYWEKLKSQQIIYTGTTTTC